MNPLLATVGTKLTERWLNLLVLPGALFLGIAVAGRTLGHGHWHDAGRLRAALDHLAGRPAAERPGTAALLVAAVLLLSAAASMAAQFLGTAIERCLLRDAADPLSRAQARRRRARWERRDRERTEAIRDPGVDGAGIERRTRARDRVALVPPSRPTWYGDRMEAAAARVDAAYGVDLAALWPRLWLVLAESAQQQVASARDSFAAGARLAAWALMYAVVAVWWWPAALVALACATVARFRARDALEALAGLVEAAADVHARELAGLIGMESPGPLSHETGNRMSELFRKGD
ncbi:hypothetical protein [Streptomyces sp. NPDC053048]|uniref:hypothetical protein n=1 Tax=Streptomyces sp. NPDC053048 TaxID=3365694 RepID=UPI0037D63063